MRTISAILTSAPDGTLHLPLPAAWEVAIKAGLLKLALQAEYHRLFSDVLQGNGFEMLQPSVEHHEALLPLPKHHENPFDRLLIAQAKSEGLTLVSCDVHFPVCGVPLLW